MFRELDSGDSVGIITPSGVGVKGHVDALERCLIVDVGIGDVLAPVHLDDG